jgi:hypothetical protein
MASPMLRVLTNMMLAQIVVMVSQNADSPDISDPSLQQNKGPEQSV